MSVEPINPCTTNTPKIKPPFRQPNFRRRKTTISTSTQGTTTGGASSGSIIQGYTPCEGSSSTFRIDPDGYCWPPTYSNCLLMSIFVQCVFLYCFIIVSSTLMGMSKASHILQVDMGGLLPNPTSLFCMFSCQHILLYFQGYFGALNIVFWLATIRL